MPKRDNPLLTILASIRLTLSLLALVALLSIVGTFIPQQESAPEFARQLSPGVARLLYSLQLFDVYHSVPFYILMGLLAANLIVCSWRRFPASWKQFKAPPFPEPSDLYSELSPEHVLITDAPRETVTKQVAALLRGKFGRIVKEDSREESVVLFGDRGRFSVFGVYIVHASILIMIAGTVVGSLWGLNAYVNIVEGETVTSADLRNGKGTYPLGFSVRCDRFTVAFYENGAPKTYRSDLSFLRNGQVAFQGPVLVNHPIEYGGIRFYQASYGTAPGGRAFITYSGGRVKSKGLMVSVGDRLPLEGNGATVEILRVEANLMEMGPAVKLRVVSPATDVQFWVFMRIDEIRKMNPGLTDDVPVFNPGLFKPYVFSLARVEQQYYTGLQVVRDPGVPFVAVGGFLMIAGLVIIYFIPHRRLWVRIDADKKRTRISFAGRSRRNRGAMKHLLDRLSAQLIKELAP